MVLPATSGAIPPGAEGSPFRCRGPAVSLQLPSDSGRVRISLKLVSSFWLFEKFRWFSFLGFLAVAGFCLWLRHERIQRICLWINRRLFHRTRGNSWFFICSGKAFVSVEICISPTGGTWLPLARNLTGKKTFQMAMNRHSWRKVDYRPEDQKSDGGLVDFFTAGFDRYATKMCDSGRLLEHDADTARHCSSFAYETLKRTAAIRGLKVK